MFTLRPIARVQRMVTGAITKLSQQRAILNQANITGGALNASAQSTVQSQRDKALKDRRDFLLGHAHASLASVSAPEAPHMEAHADHGHQGPKLHRRIRGRRQGQGQDQGAPDDGGQQADSFEEIVHGPQK